MFWRFCFVLALSDDASSDIMEIVAHSDSDNDEWMEDEEEESSEGGEDQSEEDMST